MTSVHDQIDPAACIGHVHLRVSDLERATAFYRDVLGFAVTTYGPDLGLPAVFLAAGGYHHHIALNTFHSEGGTPAPPGHTGLHHFAIRYPDRAALVHAARRVVESGHPIDAVEDHGATLAVYLSDPDGNGIELQYDRPREEWFDADGRPVVKSEPVPLGELLGAPA
jgi:catechol 2,3-dioxygenase